VRVILTGLSHKSAPVQVRERLSFAGVPPQETLQAISAATGLVECALVNTCNRMEIYGLTQEEDWQERILEFLARHGRVSPGALQDHLYSYVGEPAIRHLFRVSAGLDSMVMGEGQILGQVKESLQVSAEAHTAGTVVHALLQHAIAAGKRARTETEIGRGAVSVSLAAVQLARQIFETLNHRVVLLIGAGETAEQTARMLVADGAAPSILVCNRTLDRAEALAGAFGGSALSMERLPEALAKADIVITSTGSSEPLVTAAALKPVVRARRGRPLFLIDIAVPRDVEPRAGELDDVYLYNIDDLQSVVEKSLAGRQAEAARVEELLEEDLRKFQAWFRTLEVGPTIRQLQELADRVATAEWDRLGGRLSHLNQRDREVVETLIRGVSNKLLRPPILHLKDAANSGNGYHEVDNVRQIFGLQLPEAVVDRASPAGEERV
jgi:glutamyl-tRNA reductase